MSSPVVKTLLVQVPTLRSNFKVHKEACVDDGREMIKTGFSREMVMSQIA